MAESMLTMKLLKERCLEAAEASGVEQDKYEHYLRIAHAIGLVPAAFAAIPSLVE